MRRRSQFIPKRDRLLTVQGTVDSTHPKVCALRLGGAEQPPLVRAKDPFRRHIMHRDGNAKHRAERYEQVADMPIAQHAVVCAPVRHHRVNIAEGAAPHRARNEPSGGPCGVRALI